MDFHASMTSRLADRLAGTGFSVVLLCYPERPGVPERIGFARADGALARIFVDRETFRSEPEMRVCEWEVRLRPLFGEWRSSDILSSPVLRRMSADNYVMAAVSAHAALERTGYEVCPDTVPGAKVVGNPTVIDAVRMFVSKDVSPVIWKDGGKEGIDVEVDGETFRLTFDVEGEVLVAWEEETHTMPVARFFGRGLDGLRDLSPAPTI